MKDGQRKPYKLDGTGSKPPGVGSREDTTPLGVPASDALEVEEERNRLEEASRRLENKRKGTSGGRQSRKKRRKFEKLEG